MSIPDAVKELRDAIESEGFTAELVKEIARDYGLNPILLARKFEEQYGSEPAKYVKKTIDNPEEFIDKIVAATAEKYSKNFTYWNLGNKQFVGKRFTYLGQQYAFVAYVANQVHAVTIPDGKMVSIRDGGGPQFKNIFSQVGRKQTR
jgi:hypothetical protein